MKILVEGIEIETKEILDIQEVTGRQFGFIIYLANERKIRITEDMAYESTISERRHINNKYKRLKNEVISKWKEDKIDIPVFNL